MNKFKKIMLGALSVLTLGLFAVVGTRVNAEILVASRSIGAVTTENINTANSAILTTLNVEGDSNNVYGWKTTDNGSSSQNNVAYRKYGGSTTTDYNLRSPLLCDNNKTSLAKKAVVNINVAFSGSAAQTFDVDAIKLDGTVIETKTVSIAKQSSSKTYVNADTLTFEETEIISYIVFHGSTEKDTYFGSLSIEYYDVDSSFNYENASYYTISFESGENGSIGNPSSVKYYYEAPNNRFNDVVWPTATPNDGYKFVGWYSGETPFTINSTFTNDTVLTAKFVELTNEKYFFGDLNNSQVEDGRISYDSAGNASTTATWTDNVAMTSGKGQKISNNKAITVVLPLSARVKFYAVSNDDNETSNIIVKDSSSKVISTTTIDHRTSTTSTIVTAYLSSGTYTFNNSGKQIVAYRMDIDYSNVEPTAQLYWQQGVGTTTNSKSEEVDATDLIRVIGVIDGVLVENGKAVNVDKIELAYTKSGSAEETTKTISNFYKQIKSGSSTYEVTVGNVNVSFASQNGKYYVVYTFAGYNAFHAAGKSMDVTLKVYSNGSDTPVTASKTIA